LAADANLAQNSGAPQIFLTAHRFYRRATEKVGAALTFSDAPQKKSAAR
jgi:hypothetical protein